jgi:dTDP-4-amino-4,6-dideoxygalactose transaminase
VGAFGHAAAFSFCQDKIMTTGGEGGMLLTSSDEIRDKAWSYKDNGKSPAAMRRAESSPGFRWVHERLGSNFRMTEMQAAIGRVQLRKLDDWLATRRAHARVYREAFAPLAALRTPEPGPGVHHAYYKFYTFVRPDALRRGWTRDRIMAALCELGVPCQSGSCPEIYREKVVTDLGLAPAQPLPVARDLGETSLMFLLHPTLTAEQVARMAQCAADLIASASR